MDMEPNPNSKLQIYFFPFPMSGHFFHLLNLAAMLLSTHSSLCLHRTSLQIGDSTSFPDTFLQFHSIQSTLSLLKAPLHDLLNSEKPHCIVFDMFLPFIAQVAQLLDIPRIVFTRMSSFSMSVMDCVKKYKPHDKEDEFEVPGLLPKKVVMRREQLSEPMRESTRFNEVMEEMEESHRITYGVLINSFLDLESCFGEFYKGLKDGRAWHVGPVSGALDDQSIVDDQSGALAWLDSKEPGSVLYACFGSQVQFPKDQLKELAYGLTNSNHPFIWVLKQDSPVLSETKIANNKKGLIIKGWAPQVAILNHRAIGGFLTHCGWNSVLEGVTAGKPMLTWPVYGDQPFNEKLGVDMLGLGVRVHDGIGRDKVMKEEELIEAIEKVMGDGKERSEYRERAKTIGEKVGAATKDGGSSMDDMIRLVPDLMSLNAGLFQCYTFSRA